MKKTLTIIAAVLVAPTTAAILVGGMVAMQEARHKFAIAKQNAKKNQN